MVHSFHRAALILLPVSQNCYRYLKNAVQYFFAEIYIVMVLICFHLVNFHTYETFPISDLSQDFWYININFIFTEIQNTMQRDFLEHIIFNLLILFQRRIYYFFFIFSWFLYTTSVIDIPIIFSFVYQKILSTCVQKFIL